MRIEHGINNNINIHNINLINQEGDSVFDPDYKKYNDKYETIKTLFNQNLDNINVLNDLSNGIDNLHSEIREFLRVEVDKRDPNFTSQEFQRFSSLERKILNFEGKISIRINQLKAQKTSQKTKLHRFNRERDDILCENLRPIKNALKKFKNRLKRKT
ncbi:MAG: hypothetical protein H0W88_06450 [Parachlamydiaceae bacterium]|nr:hypothetical protein [Parachlamydiaceae bacterium]